jgi:hypothetical protein
MRTLKGSSVSVLVALLAGLSALSLAACGSSQPKVDSPADESSTPKDTTDSAPPEEKRDPGEESTQMAMPAGTAKGNSEDVIPDDYTMTKGDCVALGERLTVVVRAENTSKIPAKATEKQRAASEESIEKVATKLGNDFAEGCFGSVGKVVDRMSLKCAMDAKTADAFQTCMGGGDPNPKKK